MSIDFSSGPTAPSRYSHDFTTPSLRANDQSSSRLSAPPTWSRICATGKKLVFDIVVKQFPLFLFDHCGWKLELLCITDYSSWQKNNLGTDGNWKDAPGRFSAKEEHIDDSDELEVDISELKHTEPQAKGNSKRRLSDDSERLVRQDRLKKPKFDSALSPPLCIEPKVDPGTTSPTLLSRTAR
ncbi:hypothetical protein DFH29DRAFT_914197 [Suillus ampliporus]|nr:hypothetical protein DFH29DRAFT_914197 [Suillus ampliporus]